MRSAKFLIKGGEQRDGQRGRRQKKPLGTFGEAAGGVAAVTAVVGPCRNQEPGSSTPTGDERGFKSLISSAAPQVGNARMLTSARLFFFVCKF